MAPALALELCLLAAPRLPAQTDPAPFDVRPYTASFVSIEGDPRNGIGFVAQFKDGFSLVTEARVIDGETRFAARTGSGTPIREERLFFADNADLVRIDDAKLASGPGLTIADPVDGLVNIGDEVVVLGNNNGSGTAVPIPGKVTAIGPDAVDIDAPFAPGDSGGPVIHLKTGKVIGVAAYLRIRQMEPGPDDGSGAAVPGLQVIERRCAYRLDTIAHWSEVDPQTFAREGTAISALALRTRWLARLSDDLDTHGAVHYDDYLQEGNPLRDLVGRFRDDMIDRKSNGGTFLETKQNFLLFAADDCGNDIFSLRPQTFTLPYYQRRLQQLIRERQELSAFFNALSARQDEEEGFNSQFRRRVEGTWTPVPENEYPADYPPLTPTPILVIPWGRSGYPYHPNPGGTNSIPPGWHH